MTTTATNKVIEDDDETILARTCIEQRRKLMNPHESKQMAMRTTNKEKRTLMKRDLPSWASLTVSDYTRSV